MTGKDKDTVPHLTRRCSISRDVVSQLANIIKYEVNHVKFNFNPSLCLMLIQLDFVLVIYICTCSHKSSLTMSYSAVLPYFRLLMSKIRRAVTDKAILLLL
jgi:hypothetical protein